MAAAGYGESVTDDRWGQVDLVITSRDHSPEELADAVGLAPDRSWARGQLRKKTRRPEELSGIVYSSGLPEETHPHEQLEALITRLTPYSERIASLGKALLDEPDATGDPVRVFFAHSPTSLMPGYYMSRSQLRTLATMQASLAVSLYIDEGLE
jgi:hypothetical protein